METQVNEPSQRSPQFTVIIPVRNEEKNIAKCLASLERMQFASELFEVILVDNGSTDGTRDVAATFRKRLPLRIVERPNVYIAALRNSGAALARGLNLAFLDSDCEVLPDWLIQASNVISAGLTGIFGSFYLIPPGSSWVARNWYENKGKKGRGEVSYLPSGDLFVSMEIFRKVAGFDETIQTNEDYEFCQRVRAAGYAITCIPELAVIHWGTPQTLRAFYRKNRWHGMHVFRVFWRSLPDLHNAKPVAFAFLTLLCALGVLLGAAVAFKSGRPWFLAGSLVALFAPSLLLGIQAAFSSRRLDAILPMSALFLTYAFARASCLLDWQNWFELCSRLKQKQSR